jgi:hypothetical protein
MSDEVHLRAEAARCFRLAKGPVSSRLADELEALGRAFKREAREVEARLSHRSAHQSTRVNQHYVEAGEMAEATRIRQCGGESARCSGSSRLAPILSPCSCGQVSPRSRNAQA